jgi:DNA-binding MarR family transcriptional regulator
MRGVLERLSESGPQTVPRLAQALLVSRQFAQRLVNVLHGAGLTERVANRSHKRSWLIRLTPAG